MKVSVKVNKIIFFSSVFLASLSLLMLAINIFYFDASYDEDINIGFAGFYIISITIMYSQHLEIKNKLKP